MLGYRRENEAGNLREFSLIPISNSVCAVASNFEHEM
jgi:hypothetical protein